MKNNKLWLILVVIIVLVGIGYFYKSQSKNTFTGTYTSTTSTVGQSVIMTKTDGAKGDYLAGANGMTLYVFDKDQPNVNNCSGNCAVLWPAYTTKTTPTTLQPPLTVFTRPDGVIQYAYNQKPLYYYYLDKQQSDILGDGVGGIWHLVKP